MGVSQPDGILSAAQSLKRKKAAAPFGFTVAWNAPLTTVTLLVALLQIGGVSSGLVCRVNF